jgi:hypothetical protein
MTVINDLTNRIDRLPWAQGRHVVKGTLTKHIIGTNQVTIQVALGAASLWNPITQKFFCRGWDSCESLFYQGFTIDPSNYHFHSGGPADAPDAYFPDDIAHPLASSYSALLPVGMSIDNQPDQMAGIFKTGKFADYNEDGLQIDEAGDLVVTSDPDDALFYSTNPALGIADLKRRTRRSLVSINWPVWCHYRDYNKALIPWDDGALTPHQVSLGVAAGGSLTPGTHIWARIATLKGGDISSASKDRATDGFTTASIVVGSGGAVVMEWASQVDRAADGYRVYVGTAEGAEDRYFTVGSGATNTLTITTLSGATMGAPPEIATGALIRQISRFESNLFFPPPFAFSAALDRMAQISCMDWHYAGGLLKFLTPEVRDPVFTVNLAEIASGTFKTYKTDRRQNYNQIVVIYRDLDDQYLGQADPPVEINRFGLQAKEGARTFTIDMGCAYRSQAERVGNYWARRLIDSNQMAELEGSPKTYIVLPGDPINVTHDVPDWTDVSFYIESKEEPEDTKAGYPMTGRIYGAWYSDTDSTPLPSPLPAARLNPFVAPPVVTSCTLTEAAVELTNGAPFTVIQGAVQFAAFVGEQIGRIWHKAPGGVYVATDKTLIPDPTTLQAAFELSGIDIGTHDIKVVTESRLGVSLSFGTHPEFAVDITGDLIRAAQPTDINIVMDGFGDFLARFNLHPRSSEQPADAVVEVWDNAAFGVDPIDHLKGTLPVTPGTGHASMLNVTVPSDGIGNPPDEEGGGGGAPTIITSVYTGKNNVYCVPGDEIHVHGLPTSFVTLESLDQTWQNFEFGLQWIGDNLFPPTSFSAIVGLQNRANADPVSDAFTPDLSLCPISIQLVAGTLAGSVKEVIKSFGTEIAGGRDNIDLGFGVIDSLSIFRPGPRYTMQLSGSEYRVIDNNESRALAIVSAPSAGHDFPLRLAGYVYDHGFGGLGVTNIRTGGNFMSTIFSVANQKAFLGAQIDVGGGGHAYLRFYQKSRYSQIKDGLPADAIAPPL